MCGGREGGRRVLLQVDELVSHELFEPLQVLSVELHVVVPRPLHPQRLHGPLAALVQRQAVREVDHLVLRAVDDQHGRRHLGDLVDAVGGGGGGGVRIRNVYLHKRCRGV